MNNILLSQIEKIFESKAEYLDRCDLNCYTLYHREGILWCIAILKQVNQVHNPQDEIDLLFKTYNIKKEGG